MKFLAIVLSVILVCVAVNALSDAGLRRASSGCSGGACAVQAVQPLPADTEVAVRGWPWSKPPAPAPVPAPTPAPPVVQPPAPVPIGGAVAELQVGVEVRHPLVRAVAAPVRAAAALAGAVRNREHKPALRVVKALVGRERRAARRDE